MQPHAVRDRERRGERVGDSERERLVEALAPLLPHANVREVLLVPQPYRRDPLAERGAPGRLDGRSEAAVARAHMDIVPIRVAPHASQIGQRPTVDGAKEEPGKARLGRGTAHGAVRLVTRVDETPSVL
jgi:hypothetical protein